MLRPRWRTTVRTETGGVVTVSAEKGFLREAGNLVFHLSVLVVLVGFAVGSLFGYKGGVIRPVVAVVKSLASAIAIGSGAAVGREGPVHQEDHADLDDGAGDPRRPDADT